MSSKELVSIIIPVYNSESYLNECLNSLFDQTYQNIEIIAVDDGSTDTSLEILKNYSDKLKILSQENNGLYSALKLGISKVQGKWPRGPKSSPGGPGEVLEKGRSREPPGRPLTTTTFGRRGIPPAPGPLLIRD